VGSVWVPVVRQWCWPSWKAARTRVGVVVPGVLVGVRVWWWVSRRWARVGQWGAGAWWSARFGASMGLLPRPVASMSPLPWPVASAGLLPGSGMCRCMWAWVGVWVPLCWMVRRREVLLPRLCVPVRAGFGLAVLGCDCLAHWFGNAADQPDRRPGTART
jgi:hypothetical protein